MFSELRSFLRERLPEYMVPSAFVLVALPLNPNGKITAASQHLMQHKKAANRMHRDLLEEQLSRIWEEVLGIEPIESGTLLT